MVFVKPKECIKMGPCPLELQDPPRNVSYIEGKIHPVCALCQYYTGSINDEKVIKLRNEMSKINLLFGKKNFS